MSVDTICECKPHSNRRLPCDHVLADLFESGMSQTEVAERFGVGPASVSLHAIRLGYGRQDKEKCAVDSCDEQATSRDWCPAHYSRWYTHGDPEWTPPPLKGHGTEASYQRGCRCPECNTANTANVLIGTDDIGLYLEFRKRCEALDIPFNEGRRQAIALWVASK